MPSHAGQILTFFFAVTRSGFLLSVEAITWALKQPVGRSSAKFILVAMANCADAEMLCWPSVTYLCEATSQDRKTVLENMKRLRDDGYIEATEQRKGTTKQVVVYLLKSPENGTIKQYQKRDSTENGTVPKTEANSPVFPREQSRFSVETVPKTGHGTVKEPSRNRQGTVKEKPPAEVVTIPDWMPVEDWTAYCEHRGSKFTVAAKRMAVRQLGEWRVAGHDVGKILRDSVMNGWKGLFEPKVKGNANASSDRKRTTDFLTGRTSANGLGGSDFSGDVGSLRLPLLGPVEGFEPGGS